MDDDDCILQALAEQLGDFVEYVGGAEYVPLIITPLEMLAAAEETSVRNKVFICFSLSVRLLIFSPLFRQLLQLKKY